MEILEIENKIANSSLVSIDLEDYYAEGERVEIDIKNQLYEGIILKEKDFRQFIKEHDWSQYQDKFVSIYCSEEAVIPTWAYMLLAVSLKPYSRKIVFGTLENLEQEIWNEIIAKIDFSNYNDKKIVIKGCSKKHIPVYAYVSFTENILNHAQSVMYGEPCSTVPVYKKKL